MAKKSEIMHKERLYPRAYISVYVGLILFFSAVVILSGLILLILISIASRIVHVAALIGILIVLMLFVPFINAKFKELIDLFNTPSKGLKYFGKVLIYSKEVATYIGRRKVRAINWKDSVKIEKYREDNHNYIAVMTLDCRGKPQRDEKYINYIELPARKSIEDAVLKFSGMTIERESVPELQGEYYE
jgi:hypothetical protein